MKESTCWKLFGLFILGITLAPFLAMAAQVNPMSNVLGDTAATANTLVYRDTNGVFDAASIQDATILTAKIANGSVTTPKINIDSITTDKIPFINEGSVTSGKIVCIPPGNTMRLGVCSTTSSQGLCTCD